jgi:hypothetical protein
MKSNTRTVLAETLDDASSYSSGPLDVGDLDVLLVSVKTTSLSGSGAIAVSIVDANGNISLVASLTCAEGVNRTAVIGQGAQFANGLTSYQFTNFLGPSTSGNGSNEGIPYFGDQIQLDLTGGGTISAQVSVKGK